MSTTVTLDLDPRKDSADATQGGRRSHLFSEIPRDRPCLSFSEHTNPPQLHPPSFFLSECKPSGFFIFFSFVQTSLEADDLFQLP